MSLFDRLNLEQLSPSRLWATLDEPTRRHAAETLYGAAWEDDTGRTEADMAIATTLRFRPVAVRKLPVRKRIDYLLRSVRADDSLAASLLLALHVGARKPMLVTFLDSLEIPHQDGVIEADEFEAPDAERARPAVQALFDGFPREEVELYLATLVAMEPDSWSGIVDVVAGDG